MSAIPYSRILSATPCAVNDTAVREECDDVFCKSSPDFLAKLNSELPLLQNLIQSPPSALVIELPNTPLLIQFFVSSSMVVA